MRLLSIKSSETSLGAECIANPVHKYSEAQASSARCECEYNLLNRRGSVFSMSNLGRKLKVKKNFTHTFMLPNL